MNYSHFAVYSFNMCNYDHCLWQSLFSDNTDVVECPQSVTLSHPAKKYILSPSFPETAPDSAMQCYIDFSTSSGHRIQVIVGPSEATSKYTWSSNLYIFHSPGCFSPFLKLTTLDGLCVGFTTIQWLITDLEQTEVLIFTNRQGTAYRLTTNWKIVCGQFAD